MRDFTAPTGFAQEGDRHGPLTQGANIRGESNGSSGCLTSTFDVGHPDI